KIDEKLNLFTDADYLVYCRDHEEVHTSIISSDKLNNCILVAWSQKDKESYCFVEKIEVQDKITKITCLIKKEDRVEVTIPFTDKANIENALHVLTFLLHENFPDSLIVEGMKTLPVVAMRLEQVNGKKGSVILNDAYNSDINSLQIAIDNLGYINKSHSCIILSDILQSGLPGDELYKNVSEMVRKSKIDELFAIGTEISKYQHLFKYTKSRFFESTYHFLDYISEIDFSQSTILIKGARRFHFEQIVAQLEEKIHQTVLEINLENLVYNLNYFRSLLNPETLIMVMVKALTYGSGGKEIASVLQHQKVDYLGVAFADEGAELRRAGINLPIMVLSPSENSFRQIIEYELEPEIYSFEILEEFSKVVSRLQLTEYPVHIKVDTGMHRLGFIEEEYDQLIDVLKNNKNIFIRSVFSHLAVSDNEKEDAFTLQQIELFENITNRIAEVVGYMPRKHILNSAGIERFRAAHFDMVRLGIGLHGISSVGKQLKSVSRLRTIVSQIKNIKKGDTIGYNRRGKASNDMKIAILPIGYADGLNRKFGNGNGSVVISGETYPFIGDICMDMCMVDISVAQNVQQGDMVVVFGPERPVSILAKELDTIPYEILTSISQRVKRIYYHG
ncbi:MAG: alanine racemase, partial [Bacteroidales bacterium]|nr:alanine racemase [Bacteroidales bacterium]